MACVAAEYRLTSEARWPAHIQDVKAALRWLRSEAGTWGVDPQQIALVGFSAGAHLALLAAGTPGHVGFGSGDAATEAVNAVAAFFPPIRFQAGDERSGGDAAASAAAALGDGISDEEMEAASPLSYLSTAFPPTLLLHGTAGEVVPAATAIELFGLLRGMGVPVDMRLYSVLRHEFVRVAGVLQVAMADVALFLQRTMVDPKRFDLTQAELFGMARPGGTVR